MKTDIVIIGGGIIGLYNAYELALCGIKVTLIERGNFGAESSWAAGGLLSPLLPWHYNEAVHALCNASKHYDELSRQLLSITGIDCEYWNCGLTIIDNINQRTLKWCDNHNTAYHYKSHLNKQYLHLVDVAQIRPPKLLEALVQFLTSRNVILQNHTTVTDIKLSGDKVCGVDTSNGLINTDAVIWASGAWLPELSATQYKLRTPAITPIKGEVIGFCAKPGILNHLVYKDGHYLIPRKDGFIIAGSTLEDIGFDKQLTPIARESLHNSAITMLPALSNYKLTHQWAGLRPGSPNNLPTIGPHPDIQGLYVNCGHFRYGITMAPKSSQLICDWVLHGGINLTDAERAYAQHNYS